MRTRRRRLLARAGLGLLAVAVLAQLVPYGRDHTNPPVTQDAPWPDGRARELATAACYDCHSNQTRWPPQSHVAPGQLRGRKPARKAWTSSWEASQRSAGDWNRMA
jgi:hypothetical protein